MALVVSLSRVVKDRTNALLRRFGYRMQRLREDNFQPEFDVLAVIVGYFAAKGSLRVLIQIGANDGCTNDPVRAILESHDMHAFLLEPNPSPFRQLVYNYRNKPKVIPINAAIGDTPGYRTLYSLECVGQRTEDYSRLASFSRRVVEEYKEFKRLKDTKVIEIKVRQIDIRTLMDEFKVSEVDIVQIDAEGFDAEVIRIILESKLIPKIIQFEHSQLSSGDDARCRKRLTVSGYKLLRSGRDTICLHESMIDAKVS